MKMFSQHMKVYIITRELLSLEPLAIEASRQRAGWQMTGRGQKNDVPDSILYMIRMQHPRQWSIWLQQLPITWAYNPRLNRHKSIAPERLVFLMSRLSTTDKLIYTCYLHIHLQPPLANFTSIFNIKYLQMCTIVINHVITCNDSWKFDCWHQQCWSTQIT